MKIEIEISDDQAAALQAMAIGAMELAAERRDRRDPRWCSIQTVVQAMVDEALSEAKQAAALRSIPARHRRAVGAQFALDAMRVTAARKDTKEAA
jgi:hypothetical protein